MTPACAHCRTARSPLWRRGLRSEVLCNACGLYWRNHGRYRPLGAAPASQTPPDGPADGTRSAPAALPGADACGFPDGAETPGQGASRAGGRRARRRRAPSGAFAAGGRGACGAGRLGALLVDAHTGAWRGVPVFCAALPPSVASLNVRLVPMDVFDALPGKAQPADDAAQMRKDSHDARLGVLPADAEMDLGVLAAGTEDAAEKQAWAMDGEDGMARDGSAALDDDAMVVVKEEHEDTRNDGAFSGNAVAAANETQPAEGNSSAAHTEDALYIKQEEDATDQAATQTPLRESRRRREGRGRDSRQRAAEPAADAPAETPEAARDPVPEAVPEGDERTPVKYTMLPCGKMLLAGDHVSVRGCDGHVYFAVVRDFWRDRHGVRRVELSWLLPRPQCIGAIDGPAHGLAPGLFVLGPTHGRAEILDTAVLDVFFSPLAHRQPLGTPRLDPEPYDPHGRPRAEAPASPALLAAAIRGGAVSFGGDRRRTTLPDEEAAAALSDTEADEHCRGRPIRSLYPAGSHGGPAVPFGAVHRVSANARVGEGRVLHADARSIVEDVEIAHVLCAFT